MELGLVTYNLAKDWDLDALIAHCEETGFTGVELRTTHAHGVETSLDAAARAAVRSRFARSAVALVGIGTVCEFHSLDPAEVRANVEEACRAADLAADLGCPGIKVRPNGHQEAAGVPRAQTLAQIGRALAQCVDHAGRRGVEVRLEMHGGVAAADDIAAILEACARPAARVVWNCNPQDLRGGDIRWAFDLMRGRIGLVHINELWSDRYPWRELFGLLRDSGYSGYCLAEVPASDDPLTVMRYYRRLWMALSGETGRT